MRSSLRNSLFAFLLGALAACNEYEDPRAILDACNLPVPCGNVYMIGGKGNQLPLVDAACIHDVLAGSAPAHFSGNYPYWHEGTAYWDFYTAGEGSAVLVRGAPACDSDEVCTVLRCTLKPVDDFECLQCGTDNCPPNLQPSDLVCGEPDYWCSELIEVDPTCP
jgi:hypothetical protein